MTILLTALLACKQYDSIEEACANDVPGDQRLEDSPTSAFSLDFALRQNCYRRYIGLSQVQAEPAVQFAVEQHAEYLERAKLEELPLTWGTEVTGPEYYGADVFDRLDAAGYLYDFGNSGIWEVLWTVDEIDASGADIVDSMMGAPDWHEIILQFEPRAIAAVQGVDANGEAFVYANLLYDFPASEFRTWVTYPKDGQIDVPTFSNYGAGTPLSVVIGSTTSDGGWDGDDPYTIELVRVPQLVGPDGPVATTWTTPALYEATTQGDTPLLVRYSAVGEPARPLEPNTKYTFDGEIRWNGGEKSFRTTFTTNDATEVPTTTAITRSLSPRMRHHPPIR